MVLAGKSAGVRHIIDARQAVESNTTEERQRAGQRATAGFARTVIIQSSASEFAMTDSVAVHI